LDQVILGGRYIMKKLTINSVECLNETNLPGDDDVFFIVQVDGSPPMRYPIAGTWQMNHSAGGDAVTKVNLPNSDHPTAPQYVFNDTAYVSVWDEDGDLNWINKADMLGNATFDQNSGSGNVDVWGVDSAQYRLNVSIENWSGTRPADGEDVPEDLQQLAASAVLAWSTTDDGKAALASSDKDDLADIFQGALQSNAFSDVINKALEYSPIKAISLGLMGQAEIFVGIEGAVGFAMDLENFGSTGAVFLGAGFAEGVDAGIQGTIALGFWFQSTAEIGGIYVGAEVDVDDGLGVTAAAYAARSDGGDFKPEGGGIELKYAKVVFLGIDVGIDDGVEADETYFIAGHFENYATFQTGDYKHTALLSDLTCAHKDALAGHDDVYLMYKVDGHSTRYAYPIWNDFEMDSDDDNAWQCGHVVKFNDSFEVLLYINQGADDADNDDKALESKTYEIGDFSGVGSTKSHKFNDGDSVEYHLVAQLLSTS